MEEKKRSDKILAKFKKARAKKQEVEAMFLELDAFDRNEQWDLKSNAIPNWVPKPVTNFIHLVKYTKRAALAMENATGSLRPIGPEDVQDVEMLQKVYEFVWDKVRARKVLRENIETAKLFGTAIAQVYWDENIEGRNGTTVLGSRGGRYEGDIRLKEIDPASFYPDPTAFSLEDCQFIHIVERKPLEWLKKHPIFGEKLKDIQESKDAPDERGEIYNRDYATESDGLIDFHQHYEKTQNKEGGFTYSVTYLAGSKEVHRIEKLEPNRYPFAILYDYKQRHSFFGLSTCYFILDNQKIINKVESIIAMIGTLMQNMQKIVSKESGVNPKEVAMYGNAPGHTFVANGKPSDAIHFVQPPQIPPALFSLLENAKANIREITGLNEAYMGNSVGSLQTSSGVDSLIERATLRDRDQMFDTEMYVEDLTRIIIDFIVTKYKEPRFMRVLGEDEKSYEFLRFVGTDFKDLEFDFHIDVSSKAPITRMREQQEAQELINMQGQYQFNPAILTPQEFVKMKKYTHGDKILKRMNMEEMQNKTEQAMQVAQMMHEAMMQQVPPEEVMKMGTAMFEQIQEQQDKGLGSTSNSNNVQMRQGGVS